MYIALVSQKVVGENSLFEADGFIAHATKSPPSYTRLWRETVKASITANKPLIDWLVDQIEAATISDAAQSPALNTRVAATDCKYFDNKIIHFPFPSHFVRHLGENNKKEDIFVPEPCKRREQKVYICGGGPQLLIREIKKKRTEDNVNIRLVYIDPCSHPPHIAHNFEQVF